MFFWFAHRHEVEAYIKAKYVDRRFVRRPSDEELRSKVVSLSKQEKRLSGNSEHMPPKAPPPTPKLRPGSNASGQSGQFKVNEKHSFKPTVSFAASLGIRTVSSQWIIASKTYFVIFFYTFFLTCCCFRFHLNVSLSLSFNLFLFIAPKQN